MAWNNNDLHERIKKLEELKSLTQNEDALNSIDYSINSIKEILTYKEQKEVAYLEQNIKFFNTHSAIMDILNNFNNITSISYLMLKEINFKEEEVLTLTYDFYMSLEDKEIKDIFLKYFKENKKYFRYNSTPYQDDINYFFDVPALNEGFINSVNHHTIETIISTVHEYSHAISYFINQDNIRDYNKLFLSEIDSLFIEKLAIDYFEKTFGTDVWRYMASRYSEIQDCANMILNKANDLSDKTYYSASPTFNVENFNVNSYIAYPIGFCLSTELYFLSKEDPEQALYLLKEIVKLKNMSSSQYLDKILKLDLKPNNSKREYELLIEKNIK